MVIVWGLFSGLLIAQQSSLDALALDVLNQTDFEHQQNRHIAINDSLFKKNNLTTEFYYLDTLLHKAKFRENILIQALVEISKGNLFLEVGKSYNAIRSFQTAFSIFESVKDYSGMNSARSNIGNSYYYLGDLDKALFHYKLAIQDYVNIKDKTKKSEEKLANLYNNLGTVYCSKADYVFGKSYFDLALELWKKYGDTLSTAYIYNNYANIFFATGKSDSALFYFNKALDIKLRRGYNSDKSDAYNNLFNFYYSNKQYSNALKSVKNAIIYNDTSVFTSDLLTTYSNFATIYRELRDTKNEFHYFKLKTIVNDTLQNRSQLSNISQMEIKGEFEKIHLSDSIRSVEELKIRDLKIIEKRKESIFLIITLLLTVVALILIYLRFASTKKQKQLIELQKNIVEVKNKEITDSINYAKRLQDAILPAEKQFADNFKDHFIVYQPKDIVSGDFYFFEKRNQNLFIAAADCTGHGVPGAMLSIACSNALQKAVFELGLNHPGEILDAVKIMIIEHFNKSENSIRDGMDISLLNINTDTRQVFWAGANNRLFYVTNNALNELKPDRQPVGKSDSDKLFTTCAVPYEKEITFYLFTDGIIDQFGGDQIKKYSIAKFRKLIEEIKDLSLTEQGKIISDKINVWKGMNEQTDDITVIGIKL